jgi:hypothetical protein
VSRPSGRPSCRRATPIDTESLHRLRARVANGYYLCVQTALARLASARKLRVLFSSSKRDWEEGIRYGFQFTHHTIRFGDLDQEDLAAYDLVVPLTIEDLRFLDTVRHKTIGNPLPIPSLPSVALCDDKLLLNAALAGLGFGDCVPPMGQTLPFPYIVKKRIDQYGEHSHRILDARGQEALAGLIHDPEYFCQQFVPGPYEYATHMIMRDGRVSSVLNIEYLFKSDVPIKGKDAKIYTRVCRSPHDALFADILRKIGFEGLCCVNYKMDGGRPRLLEINPRFGASLSPFFFSFIRHIV